MTRRQRSDFIFAIVASMPFVGTGVWLTGSTLRDFALSRSSAQWQTVPAEVTRASVRTKTDRNSSSRATQKTEVTFEYRYTVDGESYDGDRYAFGESQPEDAIRSLSRGSEIDIYVDPTDPTRATVVPEFRTSGMVYFVMAGGLGALVVGGLLFNNLRPRGEKHSRRADAG